MDSPQAWLEHLEERLEYERPQLLKYNDYYDGKHPLAFATSKFKEAFGDLFSEFADNWCQLVVDVPVDRLKVEGFDFGDTNLNEAAWAIWEANDLDSRSLVAHTEAIKSGRAYVLVDPSGRITIEDPLECYVECDPADTSVRLAGLKRWIGLDGMAYANVYLPDAVYKFQAKVQPSLFIDQLAHEDWEPRPDEPLVNNPFGVVPLVPLANNPTLRIAGRSDLDVVIDLQNACNKMLTDMIVASEYQAFKQRVLIGVEVPKDPETGQPVPAAELKAAMSRLWAFPSKDAKVEELGGLDLTNYVTPINMLVQKLATKARIPAQYFLTGDIANVSAEAFEVAESGLVAKIERKQGDFGPAWREVMRLAFLAGGTNAIGKPLWKKAQRQSIAQIADALLKLRDLGVPYEYLWSQMGASPEQIAEWLKLRGLPAPPTTAPDGAPVTA